MRIFRFLRYQSMKPKNLLPKSNPSTYWYWVLKQEKQRSYKIIWNNIIRIGSTSIPYGQKLQKQMALPVQLQIVPFLRPMMAAKEWNEMFVFSMTGLFPIGGLD